MPCGLGGLSSADVMRRPVILLAGVLFSAASISRSQQPTTTPTPSPTPSVSPTPTPGSPTTTAAGVTYATEATGRVNGVRIEVAEDGGVWFLEASSDRVGVLRGSTITYWQLRADDDLGANPVDFIREGNILWILESGQGDVPAGHCMIGRLDTTTGALREWDIPGSIPAAFWRAPDGTWWVPQSGGVLQNVNLDTLAVTNYRSQTTFAFADAVQGPDGALWLADFGNNRIVRYEPGAATEKYWVFPNANGSPPNPSQLDFDSQGFLWMSQRTGSRMDRFDPSTGNLDTFFGIVDPIHFQIYQNRIYVTQALNPSSVSVLDPAINASVRTPLVENTDTMLSVAAVPAIPRDLTITPTTFDTSPSQSAADTIVVSAPSLGTLTTTIDSTATYGIAVADGAVWAGTDGKLARMTLQTIGTAPDLTVPSALNGSGAANNEVRSDVTVANVGSTAITGDFLYLYSPGSFAARTPLTLAAGATQVFPDAFGALGNGTLLSGPVRFRAASGPAENLVASVRSLRVLPSGGTFGYSERGQNAANAIGANGSATVFLGARDDDVSVLGIYSANAGTGTLTLVAPDGTVRGTRAFDLVQNASLEFNPAASAFGVDTEPGDVVRIAVSQGSVQVYAHILDATSRDVAESTPAFTSNDSVFPTVGTVIGAGNLSFITDVFLSNPGTAAANVSLAYYPFLVEGEPLVQSLTLAPGQSRVLQSFLSELFGITSGQGSILIASDAPIAAAARIAARSAAGDYAGFAPAIPSSGGVDGASATFVGLPQIGFRRTNLVLFNRGIAGTINVTGFLADGSPTDAISLEIGDHVSSRIGSVFAALGVPSLAGGRIRVDVPPGMNLYAWTAEVDGVTGDVDLAAKDR
jgi:streptogramin lyase